MAGLLLTIVCVIFIILTSGCVHTHPDPETGVKAWVTAVNDRNYAVVYNLAPLAIRSQMPLEDFTKAQENNPLLASGNSIESYTITNKSVSGDTAELTAQLVLVSYASGSSIPQKYILYIKFVEYFENGAWKVWTTQP